MIFTILEIPGNVSHTHKKKDKLKKSVFYDIVKTKIYLSELEEGERKVTTSEEDLK